MISLASKSPRFRTIIFLLATCNLHFLPNLLLTNYYHLTEFWHPLISFSARYMHSPFRCILWNLSIFTLYSPCHCMRHRTTRHAIKGMNRRLIVYCWRLQTSSVAEQLQLFIWRPWWKHIITPMSERNFPDLYVGVIISSDGVGRWPPEGTTSQKPYWRVCCCIGSV